MSTNCIIYTRFSPRPDAADSMSCEIQRRQCLLYAQQRDYYVVGTFDDPDVSGADEYREKLWAAISALRKGFVLVVYKRDRLARNVYLSEQIKRAVNRKGGTIEAVSGDVDGEGPEQDLVRQIVAAMAEYERKLISRRTSDAMRAKQRAGFRMCSVARIPYGWKVDPADDKRMVENPEEQRTIEEMREMREGGLPYQAIADEFNRKGICRRSGGAWDRAQVRLVILRR